MLKHLLDFTVRVPSWHTFVKSTMADGYLWPMCLFMAVIMAIGILYFLKTTKPSGKLELFVLACADAVVIIFGMLMIPKDTMRALPLSFYGNRNFTGIAYALVSCFVAFHINSFHHVGYPAGNKLYKTRLRKLIDILQMTNWLNLNRSVNDKASDGAKAHPKPANDTKDSTSFKQRSKF